jgi:hypothetical protein
MAQRRPRTPVTYDHPSWLRLRDYERRYAFERLCFGNVIVHNAELPAINYNYSATDIRLAAIFTGSRP